MTVPRVPRSVPALAKYATEHGWIVRDPTVALGAWNDRAEVESVALRMVHSKLAHACYALWVDSKWRSASTANLRYFKTAKAFKEYLANPDVNLDRIEE